MFLYAMQTGHDYKTNFMAFLFTSYIMTVIKKIENILRIEHTIFV